MARSPYDFYPTPRYCTEALLPLIDFSRVQSFLEPCRGDGAIYDLIVTRHKEHCEIREGRDYLITEFEKPFDLIITNPPFTYWREFVEKSLTEANTVIYLLRLNNFGSGKRRKSYEHSDRRTFWNTNPPTHLLPFQDRPSFTGKGTDMTDYAWFVWDRAGIMLLRNPASWLQVL